MKFLISERIGLVQVLTMNRPEKHNALNTGLTQELVQALKDADTDEGVHAIVLAGAGKSFCAGEGRRVARRRPD